MKFLTTLLYSLIFLGFSSGQASDFKVVFDTIECDGSTGFGNVDMDNIYRINPHICGKNPDLELKQLLVKNSQNNGRYDIFTLSADEAIEVQSQIRQYTKARLKALEQGKVLVIEE